ncbi:MAG TPA: hypothetical protein VIG99_10890, partial [Myxococcaceae bacterium]
PAIDEQLDVPYGEPTDDAPLTTHFSEQTPEHLNFLMRAAGRGVTGADRIAGASQAMARVVDRHFGRAAGRWLDNQLEAFRSPDSVRSASWGAAFGNAFDRDGLTESYLHCEWSPFLMEALPAPLHRIARVAMDSMPGLRPVIMSVRCGRSAGAQQLSFESERPLSLAALQPLMDQLSLGHRHSGLMSAAAFILGARFVLPADSATLTLRPLRQGVELRLDVNLDAIPDLPSQLMALTRLQMTERPRSVHGMDRWLMALTPDGYPGPGTVSVLSVWVRPDLPARVALYLRPASLDPRLESLKERAEPPPPAPGPVAGQALWSSSAWMPTTP